MEATKYRIEIHDYENDDPETNHPILKGWTDPEQAAETAWGLLKTIAHCRNLDCENQGDQFMAYYKDSHSDAGCGAVTMQIINETTGDYYVL